MKILLLGGTGAIGTHLVSVLKRTDVDLYITSRSEHPKQNKIKYINGNAKDMHFLAHILNERWDAIVDFMNYTIDEFRERIAILLQNTKCYYFLSSSRVYADTIDKPITEKSPLLKDTVQDIQYMVSKEYALAKAEEENILKSTLKNNWTIFRPYITYSENRFQLGTLEKEDWLFRVLMGKSIVLHKSIANKFTTLTYSHDVAEVMSSILLSGKSQTEIYNITGTNTCSATWSEIAEIYRDILQRYLGRKIVIKYIDDNQVHQLRKGLSYYQTSHDRMFNRIFDNTKTQRFKDAGSYISIREGLDMCLSQFIKCPRFSFTNYAQEALIDRFTGEYSNIFRIPSLKNKQIYLYYRIIKPY